MTKSIICVLFVLLCACTAVNRDEITIIETIQNEIDAFLVKDYSKWSNQWVHEPYALHTQVANGYFSQKAGFDSIDAWVKNIISDTSAIRFKTEKFGFKVRNFGQAAFVSCKQRSYIPGQSEPPDTSDAMFVLEKQNGMWRISDLLVIFSYSYSNTDRAVEDNLNTTGYTLLSKNKIEEAITLFKLNAQLFPESWNVYDSLGDAFMKAGRKELALKNYKTSFQLNPGNNHAGEMIKKLE